MTPGRLFAGLARRMRRWCDRRKAAKFFDQRQLRGIHEANRASLSKIKCWITDDVRRSSIFQYGLPDSIRHLIDLDIGSGVTYSDALASLAGRLRKPVRYLEIGVSVGKNFWQMTQRLHDAQLLGFDIEEINPTLREQFVTGPVRTWPTMPDSLRRNDSSLTGLTRAGSTNRIRYLSGDVFDDASWEQLRGEKFNLIFSDAFHSPDALLREQDMLAKHGLLDDDELIMAWDDLEGGMRDAFESICRRLTRERRGTRCTRFVAPFKGWLGDNWGNHPVGFFISHRE